MIDSKRSAWLALGLFVLLGTGTARAEVSVNPVGSRVNFLVMEEVPFGSFTEDPNPVGIVWIPMRNISQSWLLNPDGGPRGDRRPDSARLQGSGAPVAVWAYVPTPSSEIAFAEWDGAAWMPTEFLTAGGGWHWDPRIAVAPDGAVHVVWWESTTPSRVWLRTRPAGSSTWDPAIQVSQLLESGRRPSIAVIDDDRLWIAYERDASIPLTNKEVVVAVRHGAGAFNHQAVAAAPINDSLDVSIHYEQGDLWLTWRQDTYEVDHREWDGSGWSAPVPHSWDNYTWLGLEQIRRLIRGEVRLP